MITNRRLLPDGRPTILARTTEAGVSHWSVDKLLRAADSQGLIVRLGSGRRNKPFTYQRATTHAM